MSSEPRVIVATKNRKQAAEMRLVLSSVGIPCELVHDRGLWGIQVAEADADQATLELKEYQSENQLDRQRSTLAPTLQFSSSIWGVCGFAIMIIVVGCWRIQSTFGYDWLESGRLVAGEVMAGQWWRTVTALCLHADLEHLASNLVFGGVFGFFAGRLFGPGVAWFAILISGGFGNALNAMIQLPEHTSIGSSTAVFAALGMLVSHALFPTDKNQSWFRRWSPLIAGVALLGFTGTGGERTDVTAHVTGFIAGVLLGWALRQIPNQWLANRTIQFACSISAIRLGCGLLARGFDCVELINRFIRSKVSQAFPLESSTSFNIVFQFRVVARIPSCFSKKPFVSFVFEYPFGHTKYATSPTILKSSLPHFARSTDSTNFFVGFFSSNVACR